MDLLELRTNREYSGTTAAFCGSVFCRKKKNIEDKRVNAYNWVQLDRNSYWSGTWIKKKNDGQADLFVYKFTMFSCPADQFRSRVAASAHLTSCVTLNQFLKGQACSLMLCSRVMQNCWKHCSVDHLIQSSCSRIFRSCVSHDQHMLIWIYSHPWKYRSNQGNFVYIKLILLFLSIRNIVWG